MKGWRGWFGNFTCNHYYFSAAVSTYNGESHFHPWPRWICHDACAHVRPSIFEAAWTAGILGRIHNNGRTVWNWGWNSIFKTIYGVMSPVGCATEGQYKGFQPKTWLKTYRANIFILAKMKTYGVDMSHLGDVCTTLKKRKNINLMSWHRVKFNHVL